MTRWSYAPYLQSNTYAELAGAAFTADVSVDGDFSATGDASVGGDLTVTGTILGDLVEPVRAAGQETYSRLHATGYISSPSQRLRVTFFRARKTETVTKVLTISGNTAAAATPSLCKVGIWSIDETTYDGTLLGSASDTSMWAATTTEYEVALAASVDLTAGSLYAIATLCVTATTAPTLTGASLSGSMAAACKRGVPLCAYQSGQSDLPDPLDYSALTASGNALYAEVIP